MRDEDDDDDAILQEAVAANAQTVALRVKQLRAAKKWTQIDLAVASGIPRGTISGIEKGAGTSRTNLIALALALDTSVAVLIGEAPVSGNPPADHHAQKVDFHKQQVLLSIWEKLPPEMQDHWLALLRGVVAGSGG